MNSVTDQLARHQQRTQRLRDGISTEIDRCEKQSNKCVFVLGASILKNEKALQVFGPCFSPEQEEIVRAFKTEEAKKAELLAMLKQLKP